MSGYALSVASVVLSTLARFALNPLLGRRVAFITFFPALVFSAWAGGWGGGLIALALSTLAAMYYFVGPTHALLVASGTDRVSLLIFVIVGLSVSALSSSQRKARQQAQQSAADLRESIADLRESEAFLRASEARKSAVLEVALDCIITADAQGRILEFNPAAERTFGYSRVEVQGRPIADVIVPPSLRQAHLRGMEHYRATGEGPILGQRIEVVGMRKDKSEFSVEIAIVPTAEGGADGNATNRSKGEFTAYLRDITAIKNAATQQRAFLRDVLASVTEGHLILCDTPADLPPPLAPVGESVTVSRQSGLGQLRHLALDAAEGMVEERRHDLVTAVSECAMNTITHGGGSGIGRVCVGEEGRVQVWVVDEGGGIALEHLPRATLARGFSTKTSLGHGFKMMQQVDRVYVLTGSGGTTVVLEQEREEPPPAWL